MMSKSVFAFKPALILAAILTATGSLPSATDASAYDGYRSSHYYGRYRSHPYRPYYRRSFRSHPRYYYYGYSCAKLRWVLTRYGWRMRHVNTCYPYYRSYYDYY
jgi:hypothetical protein